jgi:hypothetical protein
MARISYDEQTAAAFKAVREVPRDGLSEWREAVRRHLRPSPGMTLVDIGAGTGAFAAAFSDWFDLSVLAVEPSAAMRDQIPRTPAIRVLAGTASAPSRCQTHRQTPRGSPWSFITSQPSASPPTRSAAFCAPVPRSSSDRASRADWTGSNSSDGSLRPLGRSRPTLRSEIRARRSRPQDSTRTRLSRFVRRGRSASRTSSASWTRSATPTPRCAISLRRSFSAARNVSAVPYDIARTQRTRKPEATGLTCWCCADRFARKANLDVLPSQAPGWTARSATRHRPNSKNKARSGRSPDRVTSPIRQSGATPPQALGAPGVVPLKGAERACAWPQRRLLQRQRNDQHERYRHNDQRLSSLTCAFSAPGRTRTCTLRIRSRHYFSLICWNGVTAVHRPCNRVSCRLPSALLGHHWLTAKLTTNSSTQALNHSPPPA